MPVCLHNSSVIYLLSIGVAEEGGSSKIFKQILEKHSVTGRVCWVPHPATLLINDFNPLGTEPHHDIRQAAHATFSYPAEHKTIHYTSAGSLGFQSDLALGGNLIARGLEKKLKCIRG